MWFEYLTASILNRLLKPAPAAIPSGITLGRRIGGAEGPVVFPDRHRCEHAVIVGKTGSGKTYLLESLALQLAIRREGFAYFDFHGDASLSLIGRLMRLDSAANRLVIIDPSHPTRSPGLNILASGEAEAERFRRVSEISSILRQRWGVDSFGARTEELLRNSLYTLAATSGTLADLAKLLTSAPHRRALTDQIDHPDISEYWRDRYEPLTEAMKAAFREPLLNKVTGFLAEPAARHLLAQPHSTIDFGVSMARGQWVIIRLPKGRLREHAHTLGNLLCAQLQFAAMARESIRPENRHTFTLICDEVQNLAENDLTTLLTEGRKFGISLITANQFWEQLPRELRGALLSAVSHICFRVSSADAHLLAGELSLERRNQLTHELTALSRGEAVARIGTTELARFAVPPMPASRPATPEQLTVLIRAVTRERREVEQALREGTAVTPTPELVRIPEPRGREALHDW